MRVRRWFWSVAFGLACSSSGQTPSEGQPRAAGSVHDPLGDAGALADAGSAPPRGVSGDGTADEAGPRPTGLDTPEPEEPAGTSSSDAGADAALEAPPACPASGSVTYTLARAAAPTPDELDAYERITAAMDEALVLYNCYTNLSLELRVAYVPSVATADGNVNGSMRFGSRASMSSITAMHEIGHTAGVGGPRYQPLIQAGIYTGESATAKLRELTADPAAELHGDAQHFWPYGLNYTSEVRSDEDLIRHALIVDAMQADFER
jgi:hypothetical protein